MSTGDGLFARAIRKGVLLIRFFLGRYDDYEPGRCVDCIAGVITKYPCLVMLVMIIPIICGTCSV